MFRGTSISDRYDSSFSRFMRKSSTGRSWIPREVKEYIFERDAYTCQYCNCKYTYRELTIDHIIPLSLGGIDEITNYLTSCSLCNNKKDSMNLVDFLEEIDVEVTDLPVHGDPIIDNPYLPSEFRVLRYKIYDQTRNSKGTLQRSKNAQKKLETAFSKEFWASDIGFRVRKDYPKLPRHVIHMLPQIYQITKSRSDTILLIELAKSAITRNLIGSYINGEYPVLTTLKNIEIMMKNDKPLIKRITWAKKRWKNKVRN